VAKRATKKAVAGAGKRGRGRPSAFRAEYCDQVEKLCRLGATDRDVASFFGVSERTVAGWKTAHPEFLQALKAGKELSDMAVANSLYRKATGYVVEAEKVIGKGETQRVVKVKIAVEPDTVAAIFWLKNRHKTYWRDRHEVQHTGNAFRDFLAAASSGKFKSKTYDRHEDDNV